MADVSILGSDAVDGDPGGMARVGRFLDDTADGVQRIRTQLESSTLGNNWEGAASQAFQELIDDLPEMLDKAHRSYALAAETVQSYASELRTRQARAEDLARQLESAQQRLGTATSASSTAAQTLSTARSNHASAEDDARSSTQGALDDAARAAENAQRACDAIRDEIERIKQEARDNRQALDSAADSARDRLSEASHLGMRNSIGSFFRRHVAPIAGAVGDALVKLVVDAVSIAPRLIAFIADPSWKRFSDLMESVAAAATIVAVVAVIVLSGGTATPLVVAIATGARAVALGASGTKLIVDTGRYARGDQDVTPLDLTMDAISLGIGARGAWNTRGVRGKFNATQSRSWQSRYLRHGTSGRAGGGTHGLIAPTLGGTAREQGRDHLIGSGLELVKGQARDHTPGDRNWFLSPRPFEGRIDNLLNNGATQIRRTFPMPVIRIPAPTLTPTMPQGATP
jgi:uncharacterized protein YukE